MLRLAIVTLVIGMMCGLAGCQSPAKDEHEPVIAHFYIEVPPQVPGALAVQLPRSGVQIVVAPRPVLGEADIGNVELVKVDLGLCLRFDLTADSARDLLRLSASNLGRRLVLTLNGKPFGARLIDGPISNGMLYIFVELDERELTETAVNLKRTAHEIQAARAEGRGRKQ